jgi:MFS family permease
LNGIYGWLVEASQEQKRALLAACLGWMLDSMDVMLYALVLGQVQRAMHLSAAMSGAMMSATLLSAAVGGIGFGRFADRFGRALMLCRIVLGLGMGGEWASGAALVAEVWPAQHRAKALALVQSSWAIGYALGAAVVALVMPHFGWRAVFFVGIAPALITIWVQRSVHEPEAWRREIRDSSPGCRAFSQRLPRKAAESEHRSDLRMDHRHAGRHLFRLHPLRLSRRPL